LKSELSQVSINLGIHARTATFVSALLLACTAEATAQAMPPSGTPPCMEDMKHFCGNVAPGQGRKLACLRGHMSQVAPSCRERLKSMPAPGQSAAPQQAQPGQKPPGK
jgi:hypothetical protein